MLTFDIYAWVCFHKTNKRGSPSNWVLWKQMSAYSTGHGHCSIASVFHEWKSAILHANSTRKTRVKKYMQNYMRKYTQIFLIACQTLHAHCYNLCVFGLLEFLHCWLSERSCTCAGGFVSKNQTFKARSNVSILCNLG